MAETYNIIIIGSGPAGYTAGIYAGRALLNPLLFTGQEPGGQLTTTTDVENYPGFPEGIKGPELMQKFRAQAERFGTKVIDARVDKVDFTSQPFKVWSGDTKYQARAIIIATGASSIWLGLENETRLKGRGVSSCATCDGFFFRGKDVVVVGGGDVALEDAITLIKFANSVKVIHRRDSLRASDILQKNAKENPKIEFVWNSEVVDVLGANSVEGVKIKNNQTNQESTIVCQGVFVAVGHKPNTDIFKGQLELDNIKGYIVVHEFTKTSVEGVFAAGDVHDFQYRQAITAAAAGCKAAMDAEKWLEGSK